MTRGMLRENGTTKGQNLRSACMDMLYAAGQKFPAFSGYIYNMNRTPPPYMISHNYTDWYDVQLFGIPAYGTGQVSYSFTPILFLFILVYHDFTTTLGGYAIFFLETFYSYPCGYPILSARFPFSRILWYHKHTTWRV